MNKNWEKHIYAVGNQLNAWPYTEVISEVKRLYPGNQLRGKVVAEIGCGTGNNLLFFGFEGCEIHALDFSPTAIEIAKSLLGSKGIKANLFCGDVTNPLPFLDDSIDIFLDRGCLTQVPFSDIPNIFSEIRRVLKKGGVFLSFTLFGDDSTDLILGKVIEKNTYDSFTGGYFSKVGRTSVYNEESIRTFLESFELLKLNCQIIKNLSNHSVITTYSFIAKK